MTSEVLVMNKTAVALAADSAVTIGSEDGSSRYLKGANKLFELSDFQPVAAMIFNSADVSGVPWEVLIKDFRKSLGSGFQAKLEGYGELLRQHIESKASTLPFRDSRAEFDYFCIRTIGMIVSDIDEMSEISNSTDDAAADEVRQHRFATVTEEALAAPVIAPFTEEDINQYKSNPSPHLTDFCENVAKSYPYNPKVLAEVAVEYVIKNYTQLLGYTGLVVAGYGESEYFPAYSEYICYGFLLDKFIFMKVSGDAISNSTPAIIKPFAQAKMVSTFMLGFGADMHVALKENLRVSLGECFGAIGPHLAQNCSVDIQAEIRKCLQAFEAKLIDSARTGHYIPLTNAVGVLPIDEMALLAETLISLESLKEKVTRPSESVGGPVDVAIITKSEGVVWVKRKHFFPGELNSKFLQRQQLRLS